MVKKLFPSLASFSLILAMLACNLPGSQGAKAPDLPGTITAQALTIQAPSNTPAAGATSAPADTAVPTNTSIPQPQDTPRPTNTPLPATPPKPKNFKADGSATAITFTWDDNSVNETGFRIYQDGVTAPIASIDAHQATGGMSYNWTGLACGFKGKFSIRAVNDAGESDSSNSGAGVTIPCAPTNLVLNGQGNAISFDWAVATQHNEDGFHIYQKGVPSPVASRGPNKGSGGTIYDLTGLPCNLVATYSVTAYNSAGESPASNLAQSETVPCPPSGFTIVSVTKDTVTYKWTDNSTSETGFHVYQDDKLYFTIPANPANGTMSNNAVQMCDVNFTVTHVYAIRAFNYAGESGWSEHVGATTPVC